MSKKPRSADGGGNWMDTYGDMVTLLLCFFVMLYSMSSLDAAKWEVFVRSISPDGKTDSEDQVTFNGQVGDDAEGGTPELPESMLDGDLDSLYLTIAQALSSAGIDGVTVSRGDGYTYVEFQDKAFFDGDSSVLTRKGQITLEAFGQSIALVSDQLEQIDIMAHTAQGDPNKPNNPRTDRVLSAMRAAEVCVFLQSMNVIEPEKLVDISFGQFRPVASNDTREGRAKNRRVEMILIDKDAEMKSLDEYYQDYLSGINADKTVNTGDVTEGGNSPAFVPTENQASEVGVSMQGPIAPDSNTDGAFIVKDGSSSAGRPDDTSSAADTQADIGESEESLNSEEEITPSAAGTQDAQADTGESEQSLDAGQEEPSAGVKVEIVE